MVCVLSSVHYMMDRIVGVSGGYKKGVRFALDTGSCFNIVRQNSLPYGWEKGWIKEQYSRN